MDWSNSNKVTSASYQCGFCNNTVASSNGYVGKNAGGVTVSYIRICPHCTKPTFFDNDKQIPGVSPGNVVENLPNEILSLYTEARNCISASAYTASVLISRKLLMNIAVSIGAKEGESFLQYVNFLFDKGYIPPNGKEWVDHIRKKGNEANHEIKLMNNNDSIELIQFSEMLLKFIYEFPNRVPKSVP